MDKKLPAGLFKAQSLKLLDEVARKRTTLLITKRGRPVARVVPIEPEEKEKSLLGSVVRAKDLVSPIEVRWAADE